MQQEHIPNRRPRPVSAPAPPAPRRPGPTPRAGATVTLCVHVPAALVPEYLAQGWAAYVLRGHHGAAGYGLAVLEGWPC